MLTLSLHFFRLLIHLGGNIIARHGYWLYKTLYPGDIRNRISLLAELPPIYLKSGVLRRCIFNC